MSFQSIKRTVLMFKTLGMKFLLMGGFGLVSYAENQFVSLKCNQYLKTGLSI